MVSTHHFAQGVKRRACDNVLENIWGTIGFFEKVEDQKQTYLQFSGEGFI